jgi:hypothetical protein
MKLKLRGAKYHFIETRDIALGCRGQIRDLPNSPKWSYKFLSA